MLGFDDVTKRFGPVTALDGCTFTARPGRLTGFVGPNGAGKTTAMRAVFGLAELDAGTIRWRGVPISAAERARFGYMPEERGLYPRMRVRDQLVYLGQLCGRSATGAGCSVDGWLDRLGLAARAADRLDALSHGNQQRVQLIAALVGERIGGQDATLPCQLLVGLVQPLLLLGDLVLIELPPRLDLVADRSGGAGIAQDALIVDHRGYRRR